MTSMNDAYDQVNLKLYVAVGVFALSAYLYNFLVTQYPGNNYLPGLFLICLVQLFLLSLGFNVLLGKYSYPVQITRQLIYLFLIYSLIALTTCAVQYTPFSLIDKKIIYFESFFHISINHLLDWTFSQPLFYKLLTASYDSILYQLMILPLLVALFGEFSRLKHYYFLILFTALIGFPLYYFFPTTAPASNLSSPFFLNAQHATGIKFNEIHNYIKPSTIQGGLVSLPSFHVMWAWICVYLIKPWPLAYYLLLIMNIFLTISCVLLGWHYCLDIVFSFIILCVAFYILKRLEYSEPVLMVQSIA
jgi:membrane-associated phospholipid phosphatase